MYILYKSIYMYKYIVDGQISALSKSSLTSIIYSCKLYFHIVTFFFYISCEDFFDIVKFV